jgi:ABC-type sugar transport system ATPase subunit
MICKFQTVVQSTCKANLVEYLGSDMIIYSSIGNQEFSCKLSSKIDVKAGDEFKFDIQSFFDPCF